MNRLRLLWEMMRGTESDELNLRMEQMEQRLTLIEQIAAFRKVASENERARQWTLQHGSRGCSQSLQQ